MNYCKFCHLIKHLPSIIFVVLITIMPVNGQESGVDDGVDIDIDYAIWLPPDISEHILDIYAGGQALGNRPTVFSKVGDSLTVSRNFLYPFGVERYDLANYAYLQPVIDYYSVTNAHIGNSFINDSLAARESWRSDHLLDPTRSNRLYCEPHETPLFCEYRLVRPSVAIIMVGTNDIGFRPIDDILNDTAAILTITEELGIIPVLTTIPQRPDVPARVADYNQGLRRIAHRRNLPLIDLYDYTRLLPNYGLTTDNVHLSSSPYGMTGTATFNAENLQYGYVMRNLATLDMLYRIYTLITEQG